ncbi:dihydrofolate reductase [Frisingicoccus sp.]|uniref:dihydrofolate reductase n=1 Tax=Frisingicoccus sp. TaxID=1918627 RepID=UPI002A819154|nr:dihydrofolate reductase [Frisingicoccus sp.]MDY4833761.1 dihydrofolate reductase [Frisingicoccus sp.]MDY4923417.1 dihydrofolate reductase [Frisingicoccus sp.]
MNIIVAVDKNWAIGFENKLLNSIPEDMKFFRETTTGKVVVMGRKTLESFPNKRPLKNRTNIVITRQKDYKVDGAVVLHSVEEALDYLKQFKSEDIYVIGGASIYEQMLPYCDVAHVTVMDYAYQADTWFPNLDKMEEFVVAADSEEKTYFDLEYCFKMYVRKSKLKEIVDFMD